MHLMQLPAVNFSICTYWIYLEHLFFNANYLRHPHPFFFFFEVSEIATLNFSDTLANDPIQWAVYTDFEGNTKNDTH